MNIASYDYAWGFRGAAPSDYYGEGTTKVGRCRLNPR
jgi:hypothetical protein